MVEFDSVFLLRMRQEALRKGVWFRVLDRAERSIVDLVPRCMQKPKNAMLIDVLAKIIVKVKDALRSHINDLINQVGRPLARRLSFFAQKWGHKTAYKWASDDGFSEYLAIVNLNNKLNYTGNSVLASRES
jgi:hypothetical protein